MPDGDAKPSRIGGFELLARLGKGGMGIVFKARQVSMDRVVALKVLSPRLAKDEAYVQRFLREARSAAKLNHPNIVQGIDAGEAGGHYYFAMEFVDGSTVKELLKREGRIEEKRALEIVGDVARALEHAHKHGIIHRDIKPDNIMVARDGRVKLADLGLARTAAKPDTLTLEGTALGTPYYMAPEQVRAEPDVDARADIYALGATLYHMVTGAFPFDGPNAGAIMVKHVTDPVPSAKERNPEVSRATDELVQHMMAKTPEDRPQSPSQLLTEIRDALKGKVRLRLKLENGGAAPPRPAIRPRVSRARAPRRSSSAYLVAAAVLLVILIAAVVALTRRGGRPRGQGTAPLLPRTPDRAAVGPREEDAEVQAAKALASALSALRTQIDAFVAKDRFSRALARLEAFAKEHPEGADEARALTSDILARARQRYDALATAADAAAKAKDFAKARVALAPVAAFGIPDLAEQAKKKLDEIDSREKKAELWARWDPIRDEAAKLAAAGKFDEALATLEKAKEIALDNIIGLIAEEARKVEDARRKAAEALLVACRKESDKVWALFKERQYAAADKLLAALAAKAEFETLRGRVQADQEAAKLLGEFWAAVERGVAERKGTISVEGAVGNVIGVKNGVITIRTLDGQGQTRRVEQLTAKQALLYADLKDDAHSRRVEGVFLLAEGEDLTAAGQALAAAGESPAVALYSQRLATLAEQAVGTPATPEEEKAGGWRPLFDGKSLDGWRLLPGVDPRWVGVVQGSIGFYEHGRIGVGWTREFPTDEYEVVIEAQAVKGKHHFCEIVFPVGATHYALVAGVGFLGIDGVDGKPGWSNRTTVRDKLRTRQWYLLRVRVTSDGIRVWVDREQLIHLPRTGARVTPWPGFETYRPFGISSFRTRAAIRRILVRSLDPRATAASQVGVAARCGWQNTGRRLVAGHRYELTATGTWSSGPRHQYGPEGTEKAAGSEFLLPGASSFCLIGRLGPDGKPFLVGTRLILTASASALLYLAMNDDRPSDNSGELPVTIRELPTGKAGEDWRSLFDGKSLEGWSPIQEPGAYARPGNVAVKDEAIVLEPGNPLTGVLWEGDFPKGSYELTYEAAKLAGPYQFGGVVFPVGGSSCSLTLGAGAQHNIVGLSSVDGKWAGGNLTHKRIGFQHGRWYRLRLRVTKEKIEVWLDDEQIVDLPTEGHTFTADGAPKDLRSIAFNGYGNTGAIRDIRVRELGPEQPQAP